MLGCRFSLDDFALVAETMDELAMCRVIATVPLMSSTLTPLRKEFPEAVEVFASQVNNFVNVVNPNPDVAK